MMVWSMPAAGRENPVFVTVPTQAALLSDLSARFDSKTGFAVATLNLDHVVKLHKLASFREAYRKQTHITADGNPIVWLSRLAGQRIDLVPGSELVDPVAALASTRGVNVAVLGSTKTVLERAAEVLVRRHPGLKIVLKIAPSMDFDPRGAEADACVDAIGKSGCGLCYLALGAPKQEIFASLALERLPNVGFLSVGAGLDFIAGEQWRAPHIARMLAAEWLWRAFCSPGRLSKRYMACMMVLPRLIVRATVIRISGGRSPGRW